VIVGDFADVGVEGKFSLIYAPFTTFFALPSQAEQIRCLRNVESHLEPDGWFVLDAFVPDVARYRNGQSILVHHVGSMEILLEVARHDPIAQRVESAHIVITDVGVRIYPVVLRYAWPAELDVMAMVAGLTLSERCNDYDRRPFNAFSMHHVSLYRKSNFVSSSDR
jgi:hypothetical protein